MSTVVKTLYCSSADITKEIGKIYEPPSLTTLNELYNITAYADEDLYKINNFIIGMKVTPDDSDISFSQLTHNPYDANVYLPLPFLMRPTNEVISSSEYNTYSLFTTKTIENVTYNIAYGKRFSNVGDVEYKEITNNDGIMKVETFDVPNINPLHPSLTKQVNLFPATQKFIACNLQVIYSIDLEEKERMKSYVDILYPNRTVDKYILGEVAFIQSVDGTIQQRRELKGAQPAYFIKDEIDLTVSETYTNSMDMGANMPLVIL